MRGDWDALRDLGDVSWNDVAGSQGWRRAFGPKGWLPSRSLIQQVARHSLVYQWFAEPLAPVLAARLVGRPAVVVAGGYDVAAEPSIRYGKMIDWRSRLMGRLVLKLAGRVLCFSHSAMREVLRWTPGASATVVYPGLQLDRYRVANHKRRQVVTIAPIYDGYVERKGLMTFARASRLVPEAEFIIVGKHGQQQLVEKLRREGGPNLRLPGYLEDQALRTLLSEAEVYAQLSLHEGFGYALAEAMLSGCTPVSTRCGSLPEVVGDTGCYVAENDPVATAEAIRASFVQPSGDRARDRVARLFSAEKRRAELQREVSAMLDR